MSVGGILSDIYTKFEGAWTGLYVSASNGISGYVIPIAWVLLAILMLVWCFATMSGKTSMPVMDWLTPCIAFMIVLYVMGSGYVTLIANPLFKLPEDLVGAIAGGGVSNPITAISTFENTFIGIITGLFTGLVDFVTTGAWASAVLLLVIMILLLIVGIVLMVVVFCGFVYAKLGLTMVLAVGPFFILMLVLPQTRDRFYAWLSTALYFVMYYVLCYLFISLFFNFLTEYLSALVQMNVGTAAAGDRGFLGTIAAFIANRFAGGDAATAGGLVTSFMPVILFCLILVSLFMRLDTISSSMTSGSGGTAGAGVSAAGNALLRAKTAGILGKRRGK